MNNPTLTASEMNIVMDNLAAEFPAEAVHKLTYDGKAKTDEKGNPIEYIASHAVIGRLNEAFGGAWSFEIPWQQIGDQHVAVRGRLTACDLSKEQFGSAEVKRYKDGHSTKAGQIIDIGNDLKSAASDALKKCASLFGVGLYLQDKEGRAEARRNPQKAAPTAPSPAVAAANGALRVSEERAAVLGRKAVEAGWSREHLIRWLASRGKQGLRELFNAEADEMEKDLRLPF